MDPALIKGDNLTVAQIIKPPSCDIPFKSGVLDVSENGSDFREQTCVLRFDRFYCLEKNSINKYPNVMIHMTDFWDLSYEYREESGFRLPFKGKILVFKARSLADGKDWVIRLCSMKYLNYQFVTIKGCSTLVNNWHVLPSDPIMLAKQLQVKQIGVTEDYLKGMHEKDFYKNPHKYCGFASMLEKPESSVDNNRLKKEQKALFRDTNLQAIRRMKRDKHMKPRSRERLEKLISESG